MSCGIDLANPIIRIIHDEQIPGRVNGDAVRSVQLRRRSGAIVTRKSRGPISCHCGDHVRRGIDPPNPLVQLIRDEEVPPRIDRNGTRLTQLRRRGCAIVTRKSRRPISRHRRDHECRGIDLTNPIVLSIRDIEVPRRVDGDVTQNRYLRRSGGTIVTREARCAIPRHRVDEGCGTESCVAAEEVRATAIRGRDHVDARRQCGCCQCRRAVRDRPRTQCCAAVEEGHNPARHGGADARRHRRRQDFTLTISQ